MRKANWGPLRWRGPGCSTRSGVFGPCPPIILRWWCRVSAPLRPPCCSASFCARPVQNSGGVAMAAMEHPWRLNVSPACMQGCGNREIADPWASWADPRAPRATVRASFSAGAPRRAVLQRPQRLAEPVCGPDVLAWTYHRPAVAHSSPLFVDLAHLPPARGHLRALRKRLPSASWRRRAWHEEEPCPGRMAAARPISHGASSSWAPPRPRNVPRPASSQIGRSVPSTQINRYEVCRERPRTTRASQLVLIAFQCRIGAAIRSPSPDRLAGGPPAP